MGKKYKRKNTRGKSKKNIHKKAKSFGPEGGLRTYDDLISSRPKDAQKIILNTLLQVDCLSCGECCRGFKVLTILKGDILFNMLGNPQNFRGHNYTISNYTSGYAMIKGENDDCTFLKEDNGCSVYDKRPSICRIFPFVLTDVKSFRDHSISFFSLSSKCPIISKLKEQGITVILSSDLAVPLSEILQNPTKYISMEFYHHFVQQIESHSSTDGYFIAPLLGKSFIELINYADIYAQYGGFVYMSKEFGPMFSIV